MSEIKVVETNETPVCPHCDQELAVVLKNTKGLFERHIMYMCPHCKKLLSIGNDMGFGN